MPLDRSLVDRDAEVAAVLARGPAVGIVGPRGVGTTAVLRAAVRARRKRGDTVTLVPCRGATTEGEVLRRIAGALDLPEGDPALLRARVGTRLDDGPRVLALDDVETDLGDALLDWTATAPDLRVLTAGSVAPHGAEIVRVAPLSREAAERLLRREIERAGGTTTPDRATLGRALAMAGGLPRAIGVVGARLARLGGSALDVGAFPALEQSLRWVLGGLPDDARRAAAELSVFRGAFRREDALAVLGGADAALEALVAASLVVPEGDRWTLVSPLRDLVAPTPAARALHARRLAGLAEAEAHDREDLEAALALARNEPTLAALTLPLGLLLDAILLRRGAVEPHLALLRSLVDVATTAADEARVRGLLGRVLALHGRAEEASHEHARAVDAAERAGDRSTLGWALAFACFSLRTAARMPEARAAGARAVEIARGLGDDVLTSMALEVLGLVDQDEGDHDGAIEHFVQGEAHARRAGHVRLVGISAANHAMSLLARDDGPGAEAAAERATRAFASAGDQLHVARTAWILAGAARLLGRHEDARRMSEEARRALAERGDDAGELEVVLELLLQARVARDAAREAALEADAKLLAARVGDASILARTRAVLAGTPNAAPSPSPGIAPRHVLRGRIQDGRLWTLELDGVQVDLGRRGPLRLILLALARSPGRPFTVQEVQEAGWPDEKMSAESGAARVYMTMRRLRALGFASLIVTDDAGYRLHASVRVELEG